MDHDGLCNIAEYGYKYGTLDPADPDSDHDGMPDGWELWAGLDPLDAGDSLADPDNDGINYSLKWADLNGDSWPQAGEWIITVHDCNGDGVIDPYYENESYCNLEEYWFGRDTDADGIREWTDHPSKYDTDGDGIIDGYEEGFMDSDDDGMSNVNELRWGLDPLDPDGFNGSWADIDNDGFMNIQEVQNGTDPRDPADYPNFGRSAAEGAVAEGCRPQDE
jgi:hypothetical protein